MKGKAQMLEDILVKSGMTKTFIAGRLGVSRPRLDAIIKTPGTATYGQAEELSALLGIKKADRDYIFLP